MKVMQWLIGIALASMVGCNRPLPPLNTTEIELDCDTLMDGSGAPPIGSAGNGALLATRFCSLEELGTIVRIEYSPDDLPADTAVESTTAVQLIHKSRGLEVISVLESGISQEDILKAKEGSIWDHLNLIRRAPYAVANRADLQRVFTLARRLPMVFREGDPSFFDIAQKTVENINTEDLAFRYSKDTTEKGYLNSFNHITAQAFITSIFSEDLADLVADLHERKNMRELTTGKFKEEQINNPDNNPVDNYVDMINNEWGQELGKRLKEKYRIDRETKWTPELLANYLNDIQNYCSWAFQIGFKPFRPEDNIVLRFTEKLNLVMTTQA
jgi:hypothetical protein